MTPSNTTPPLHVDVTVRGPVPARLADEAARRIRRLQRRAAEPLLHAHVVLTQEADPRIDLPAHAEAELVLPGGTVHARAAAPTMAAAIDELTRRLRERCAIGWNVF